MKSVLLTFALGAAAPALPQQPERPVEWLLVWVAANVSAASLPDQQRFYSAETCDAAAQIVNDLTAKTGIANSNVPINVRAACIQVPAAPAPSAN